MKNSNHSPSFPSTEVKGNFEMCECICGIRCVHGREVRMFNLGRGHYIACDKCKTYIFVGENLKSDWRQENKDIWEDNYRSVKGIHSTNERFGLFACCESHGLLYSGIDER